LDNIYSLSANVKYQPVVCVETFITVDDLDKINQQMKLASIGAALVGGATPKTDEEFEKRRLETLHTRKSNVSFLSGNDWTWLYDKLCLAINHVNVTNYFKLLYGIEPLQYAEYDSQYRGFYGPHADSDIVNSTSTVRSLSFSVQLSDPKEYEGGDLKIYDGNTTYIANKNLCCITFFNSNMFHEVTPVTSGFRKSLVGWVVGPRV
jgi:PKHD-type hydroxylase